MFLRRPGFASALFPSSSAHRFPGGEEAGLDGGSLSLSHSLSLMASDWQPLPPAFSTEQGFTLGLQIGCRMGAWVGLFSPLGGGWEGANPTPDIQGPETC